MKNYKIRKYSKGIFTKVMDPVAEEIMLKVEINSKFTFEVALSPMDINEFVTGHLFAQGMISSLDDILQLEVQSKGDLYNVKVEIKYLDPGLRESKRNYNIIWTECGNILDHQFEKGKYNIRPVSDLKPELLFELLERTKEMFDDYQTTGAHHSTILYDLDRDNMVQGVDIGRHSAFDKMIGKALLNGITSFDRMLVFSTGRLSSDIVLKTLNCSIPVLVSRGAPLSGAINLAKHHNLTLIGFLRGHRFNLYTNLESMNNDSEIII